MLKSSACLQCKTTEGEQAHWTFHNTRILSPKGHRSATATASMMQLHQSVHTAEFKCNLPSFPLCAVFFPCKTSEPSKGRILEQSHQYYKLCCSTCYIGLDMASLGNLDCSCLLMKRLSSPPYSINLMKGFTEPIQDSWFLHKVQKISAQKTNI